MLAEKSEAETTKQKAASSSVNFWEAFRYWLKLGFINFGGPAGQIALMHKDLVEGRKWISEDRFLHALNFCMLLPGPEAQQLAIYIGWLLHRTAGGIIAGTFFVLPSIFVLLALSYTYAAYGNVPFVIGVLNGFKPVVVAIVVEAVLKIGKRALKHQTHFLIAAAAFVAIYFLHVPFPLIVVAAAIIGLLTQQKAISNLEQKALTSNDNQQADISQHTEQIVQSTTDEGQQTTDNASPIPASRLPSTVISDDAPSPAHTLPNRLRSLKIVTVGFALWALPLLTIVIWRGWSSPLAQLYRFFTQAALVTFGGAYAVLAYVTQAAVGSYGWLTQAQAVDGLALAETTPGPLIMVLQFLGFMAGWNNPSGMNQTASAMLSALVTTYTTFLPSFLFILLGAPYIESLRGNKKLTAALSGVTAAVVGVILNLAIVFGAAVIWPTGKLLEVNWFAALMSVAALIALYRFKVDVLWVVLSGALIGLAHTFLSG